jgi:hypothetical protein
MNTKLYVEVEVHWHRRQGVWSLTKNSGFVISEYGWISRKNNLYNWSCVSGNKQGKTKTLEAAKLKVERGAGIKRKRN